MTAVRPAGGIENHLGNEMAREAGGREGIKGRSVKKERGKRGGEKGKWGERKASGKRVWRERHQ